MVHLLLRSFPTAIHTEPLPLRSSSNHQTMDLHTYPSESHTDSSPCCVALQASVAHVNGNLEIHIQSEVAQFSKCRSQHLLGCARRAQFRIQQQSKGGFMTCCLRHGRLHTSSCHGRWPLQPILAILTAWPLRARRSEFGHVARASAVHVENDE